MNKDLSQDYLKSILEYSFETGEFFWKVRKAIRCPVGKKAGTPDPRTGHLAIRIDGCRYYAHQLAWLYNYGKWPEEFLDHINGNPSDNRIDNLREADRSLNMENRKKAHKNNISGYLGVSEKKNCKRWSAKISVKGKRIHLGLFKTPEEAHQAYLEAKRKYHEGCTI